ncbi:MAG: alpha/beta hydrolase [Burkholderiaceae bacterium]
MSSSDTGMPVSTSRAAPILFLHANGFPSGAYRQFLEVLGKHHEVIAPQVIDTPAAMRASQRWPQMVEQVQSIITESVAKHGSLAVVGHSMGGYLALMAGARQSAPLAGIVLLDSPLVTGWRGTVFDALRVTGLTQRGGPAPIAARRRDRWESSQKAREHFESKTFAQRWAPGVLDDFIAHGLNTDPEGRVCLRIAREAERDIYAQLPAGRALRAYRRLRDRGVPMHMIAGRYSAETRMAGRHAVQRLFGERWHEIDGGHLVPMEKPRACAELVLHCLSGQGPSSRSPST